MPSRTSVLAAMVAAVSAVAIALPLGTGAALADAPSTSASSCSLGPTHAVSHVIYIQFDNTHLLRDNPNVPSDIEQIPVLRNFMEDNGTVLSNDHTPLIAHTADDLLTSETGLYPDNQGIAEANSYRYYEPNGNTDEAGSFSYWTDPVDSYTTANGLGTDSSYNILTASGRNTPAPWVPFTRSGCNVGEVALADLDLENAVPDASVVFGPNSPEAADAQNPSYPFQTEYQGLAVHCARGSAVCADNPGAVTDRLPDEPQGYQGYQAVFGARFLDPFLSSSGEPTNLDGQVIRDGNGVVGFPGYDSMQATNALAYTLDMQERGVPVTYTYLTDLHDNATTGAGMGPGEATYEQQLRSYNGAFTTFFAELAAHGINRSNTLFVFGEDENDHYVGSSPTPGDCNGVTVTCTYGQLGELETNLQGLLSSERGITTPFTVHSDSAPFVYLTGDPPAASPTVRAFERALAGLTAPDPYTGNTVPLSNYLADPAELKVLHMITGDPARTPTLAMFANPDFYLYTSGKACSGAACEDYGTDVWNHGDVSPDINRSWMAFVGPGVRNLGVDGSWVSETDTRPTMMALLGLTDDYQHEGTVLTGIIDHDRMPSTLSDPAYAGLAGVYTQLESPVGPFGLDTLAASTRALASDSPHDAQYTQTEAAITRLGARRDRVGGQIIALLEGAAFSGRPIPPGQARHLSEQGQNLLRQARQLGQT